MGPKQAHCDAHYGKGKVTVIPAFLRVQVANIDGQDTIRLSIHRIVRARMLEMHPWRKTELQPHVLVRGCKQSPERFSKRCTNLVLTLDIVVTALTCFGKLTKQISAMV